MMKNESGRSMVEMLGVLAIIGVLSVGGIAGYTMAMEKYKANEIMAVAAQCSIIARSANQGAGEAKCDGITWPSGVDTSSANKPTVTTDGEVTITFSDHKLCLTAENIKASKTNHGCGENGTAATFSFS